ncbi:MAG: class I SAM-dependent methyltransferase [Planctomycetes bacterium]|nr:class I SAM-dependent methyltransferase [Planctomycetota bacterium]
MRTYYEGHDSAYIKKKTNGEVGWSTVEETNENYRTIRPLLEEHVSSSSCLLELGCGAGDLTEKLLLHTHKITGVDISKTAISWALSKTTVPEFLCKNLLCENSFPKNSFDIAVDSLFMHCIIGNDRKIILENIHSWLKPNGKFILNTMCGEPFGVLRNGYCEETRNIYYNEIATRHIGKPDVIVQEIEACNFITLQQSLIDNMLASVHQCA